MDVDNTRLHDSNLADDRHDGTVAHNERGVNRSPIVTRRGVSARRGAGTIGQHLRGKKNGEEPLLPPLLEVHFEMNPRDPDYDFKIYLAFDQASEGRRAGGKVGVVLQKGQSFAGQLGSPYGADKIVPVTDTVLVKNRLARL